MLKVASYCTIFLKPEMLHLYRQVIGLKRYQTKVFTKTRQQEKSFPFERICLLPKPKKRIFKRFISKYLAHEPSLIYRGEADVLSEKLREYKPDVLHVYFGHTAVHLLPFLALTKIPYVVSFHGADAMPRMDQPGYLDNLRKLLQVIPFALARSNSLARRLQDLGCSPEKIRINRTGIPLDNFLYVDRSNITARPLRFVQACRLIEKKGLRTTLLAFSKIRNRFPESTLVIAGDGPLKEKLSALVVQLGLVAYVSFVGFLDQDALRSLYAVSDIFVHPSETTETLDQEGVPNAMLEAMATGLPVVATNHGGIPEAVTDHREGLLVAEKDVTGLAEAMFNLASDPKLRLEMGRHASAAVREKFEWHAQIARLESFYDEAIALRKAQ